MCSLSRHLPDKGVSASLCARCPPLHLLSHDRTQRSYRREFRPLIGNRIFGCDDCLAVCPWNKFAATAHETKLQAREELTAPPIADLLRLDDAAFRALFTGSAVKRIGYDRFMRNVLIAAGNSGDPALAGPVAEKLNSPSALMRAMAVWALGRLVSPDDLAEFECRFRPSETDEMVEIEWVAGDEAQQRPRKRLICKKAGRHESLRIRAWILRTSFHRPLGNFVRDNRGHRACGRQSRGVGERKYRDFRVRPRT